MEYKFISHKVYVLKCLHAQDGGEDILGVYTNSQLALDKLDKCDEYGAHMDIYNGDTGKRVKTIR